MQYILQNILIILFIINQSIIGSKISGLFSRAQCKSQFTQHEIKKSLKNAGVTLIGGSTDESPMAYKDITKVMALQTELVDIVGTFTHKIVKMDK